ncbi:MAG TPA: hypothetical protein VFS64_10050 [Solirubrobacterales bacterium]|nr:hypothetical protein [Solirubrobacterales bacterium]
MSRKPSPVLLAAIAVAAALWLAACGGSGDAGSSSAATTATSEASRQDQRQGSSPGPEKPSGGQGDNGRGHEKSSDRQGGSAGGQEAPRHVPVAPLQVSGGGSAQFHVKGGDNSVQEYGEEAGEAELRQAAEATHSLFVANVRGEWARACSLLAADEQKSLEKLAAQSPQLRGKGCAPALAALTQPVPGSLAREITRVDAAGLRHEGEQAFLIYVGAPEGTVYAMPLRLEGGLWKPAAISGNALPGVPTR